MSKGPSINEDGSVVSSALTTGDYDHPSDDLYKNFNIMLGQIEAIYTIDAQDNSVDGTAGISTRYDVRIFNNNGHSEIAYRCRVVQPLFGGGFNNFLEVLPTDPGFKGKTKNEPRDLRRGHMVLVGFISGQKNAGVIFGAMPHESKTAQATRPKAGLGVHTQGEIQGLNFSVDNDGALKITVNGPRDDKGKQTNAALKTVVHLQKDGSVEITTGTDLKQKVRIDSQTKHIRVDNGPTYIDMDQTGDKIQVVAKIVEVGTNTLQPQVVGDDWKKIMEDLIDAITQIIVPTGVGPSGNPVNKADFLKIKSNLKEALSKNHKVEK